MMKKIAEFKNYFSRKRTSFSQRRLSLSLLFVLFGAMGLWGDNFVDRNEIIDADWSSNSIWKKQSGLYFETGDYPGKDGSTDDNVYFSAQNTTKLKLLSDITVSEFIAGYKSTTVTPGTSEIIIDLNGCTLTCDKIILNNNNGVPVTLTFIDKSAAKSGSVVTRVLDYSDNQNHTLTIDVPFTATEYNATSGTGSLTITGSVAPNLPATALSDPGLSYANTWKGTVSSDWSDATNWSAGVPSVTVDARIPATLPAGGVYPEIPAGVDAICKSLDIESGASVTVNGSLTVSEDCTLDGIHADSEGSFIAAGKLSVGTGITVENLSISAATFENSASLTCKSIEARGASTLMSTVTTSGNQLYTGKATVDGNSITLSSTVGGITFDDEIEGTAGSNLTLTLDDTSKNIVFKNSVSLKNLTLNGSYNGVATSDITCTGAFTANNGGQFRGDITAASVSITGAFSLCGACSKVETTGAQVYDGEASLLRDTPVNLIAGGGVTFKQNLINQNDGAAAKSITFGTSTTPTDVEFQSKVGVNNALADIVVYGDLTAFGTIKAASVTVIGTAKISGNLTTTGTNTFNILQITGTGTSFFSSSNDIQRLSCTAAGKTLEFAAGTTQTVTSSLTITGSSGNEIVIKSDKSTYSAASDRFTLNVDSAAVSVNYSKVQNSSASQLITPSNSISLGNNVNWNIRADYVWSGNGEDSDWKNLDNWTIGGASALVPATYPGESSSEDTVTISTTKDGTGKWPVYNYAQDITLQKITIGTAAAEFTLNTAKKITLTAVTGISNSGTIIFQNSGRFYNASDALVMDTAKGTIEYSGSADEISNFGSDGASDYYNLVVKSASIHLALGHQIKVSGNFTLDNGCKITGGQSLYITGTSSIGGNITTDHDQTYSGKVTFTDDASILIAAGDRDDSTPYQVIFNDTVEGKTTGTDLTFDDVKFAKAITNIGTLTVNETTVNNGTIQTSGLQTYTGKVSGSGEIKVPEVASGKGVIFAGGFECAKLTGAETTEPEIAFTGGTVKFTTFTVNDDIVSFGAASPNSVTLDSNLTAGKIHISGPLAIASGKSYVINATEWETVTGGAFTPEQSTVKVSGKVSGNDTFYNLEAGGDLEGNHTITKLTINGTAESTSKITGSNTTDTFICRTAKKTIVFTAGTKQTVTTTLTINASAGNEITLGSSAAGSEWELDAPSSTVSNVIVSDSNAVGGTITANASLSKGGNTNWIIPGTYYWTGSTDTAWNKASNWSVGFNGSKIAASIWPGESGSSDVVYISEEWLATDKDYPKLASAISLYNLYLGDASHTGKVELNTSGAIAIGNAFTNYGTVTYKSNGRITNSSSDVLSDVSHNGTVEFAGTGLIIDDIPSQTNDYYNLVLSGSEKLGGTIRVGNTTTLSDDTAITTDDSSYSISFGAIQNAAAHKLDLGDSSHQTNVTFRGNIGTDSDPIGALTVYGDVTFGAAITVNSNDVVTFNKSLTASTYKLTLKNATAINFTGDNTFTNLEISGKTLVNFDASSFQKITSLTLAGTDATDRLVFGGAGEWFIYLGNKAGSSFAYTTLKSSTSVNADNNDLNELAYNPSSLTLLEASVGSTKAWFEHKYYWGGTATNKWSDSGKWFYDDVLTIESPVPAYNDAKSKIVLKGNLDIAQDASITDSSLSLLSLTIDADKRFALAGKNLSLALSGAQGNALENYGTFALYGTSGQAVSFTGAGGKSVHGDGSTIEYYGTGDSEDVFAVSSMGTTYCTYKKVSVTKTSGTMTFNKAFGADALNSSDTLAVLSFKGDFTIAADTVFNQQIDVQKDGLVIGITGTGNKVTFNKDAGTSDSTNITTLKLNADSVVKKQLKISELQVYGGKSLSVESSPANDFACDKLTFLGSGNSTFALTSPAAADIKSVQINSGCKLSTASTFYVKGNWTNNGSFEASAGTITFSAERLSLSPSSEIETAISGTNTFFNVVIQNEDLTKVTGSNSYQNFTIKHPAGNPVKEVQFAANVNQTVNKTLTVTGTAANKILLTTTAASPSANTATWWKLAGIPQYTTANWAGDQKIAAIYAQIQYCAAENNLTHDWGTGLASMDMALSEGEDESTSNLFIRTFYWYGGKDTAWGEPENWSAQEDTEVKLEKMTPPYAANTARIVIVKSENNSGYHTLKTTDTEYKIKSFTVKENAIVDLGDSSLSLKADEKLTNNGRIKMSGTQVLTVSGTGSRVNGTSSVIEYCGDCSSMPWGRTYQNLEFTSGAKTTSDYSSDLTVNGTTKFINGNNSITITGANDFKDAVTFGQTSPAVSAGDITLSGTNKFNSKPVTIISGGNLQINADTSGVSLNDSASCTSLIIDSRATLLGSVTTTATQTYKGAVTLSGDGDSISLLANNTAASTVEFQSTVSGAKNLIIGDRGNSKKTNVTFARAVGTSGTPLTSVDVYGTALVSANIYTENTQKYNDALTWKNAVTLTTGDGSFVQFNGGAVPDAGNTDKLSVAAVTYLTGSGNFGGGAGIDLNKNAFVGDITAAASIAIKDNVFAKADFYISSKTTGTLNIDSSLNITGNLALFNGKVNAKADITAGKDIVLLSGSGKTDGDGTSGTSGKDIFVYNLPDRPKATSLNISSLSPPSGITCDTAVYNSSLSPSSGITIQAGQNFFDNGVSLSGAGSWNLKLKDNTDSKDAFAEIYNATVKNCQVSAISGTAYLAAAEATNVSGNNANVCFTRPGIKTAYTEYDDVIKVEFWDGTNPLAIENTNDEIWTEFVNRAWYGKNGKAVLFAGTYTDAECTVKTTGSLNLTSFYLKARIPDADTGDGKWNTDATGSSAGATESTDRSGKHRDAVPYINLPKALTDSYSGLRDVHKNRVASYYTAPAADLSLSPAADNAAPGKTYTATEDGCAPVLVEVSTGREKHIDPHSTTPVQKQYDAHNFIEFVYSEPVDIGDGSNTVGDYNFGSKDALGNIQTMGTVITVKGLATLEKGSVNAESKAAKPVHSLYRKFDTGSGETLQSHRVRLAIAGYVDGSFTVNGKSYFNWTSYIESSQMPSGDVSRVANANIKDRTTRTSKNTVPAAGTTQHPLPSLKVVNNKDTNLYDSWDVTPPSFVPLRLNGTAWEPALEDADQYEAVGAAYSGHAYLDSIEIHMFDDQPSYSAYTTTTAGDGSTVESGEKNQWFSKIGWDDVQLNNRNNSGLNVTPAANQRGGIRYSSIYNIAANFQYRKIDDVTFSPFANKPLEGGAESSVFTPAAGTANSTLSEDGCYYRIYFPGGTKLDPKLKFMLTFDAETVYLTDLAGNRIRNRASGDYFIPTVDRTPPAINMTATPCGKDELYIVFAKSIKTEPYKVYKDANTSTEISNPLEYIPKALQIQGVPSVQIDTTRAAKLVHRTFNSTGFIVYLDKQVDWQDIKAGYQVKIIATTNPDHRYDPLSGVTADVTYIQDDMGNYASAGSIHTLTDFAVNVVDVEYAYNENINDTSGNNIQEGLYETGSWAVHDWSREQGNFGVLNPNYDIFMRTKFFDGTDDNTKGAANINQLTLRFDENPDSNAVSSEYNSFSGREWRIWLPYPYTNIAPAGNPGADSISIGPTALADDDNPYHFDFEIPLKTGSYPDYGDGDTVSFLFEIQDNGSTVEVDHFGNGVKEPLYALRLSDPNDSSSLDLWSFKLRDTVRQRGGVTILNNVINPLQGEKTVIRTDFTSESNVNIMVMTLDGNIVTYLNRGNIPAGEQYLTWDGRNTKGEVVARGMYFIRIVGNGIDETRKVMIVK